MASGIEGRDDEDAKLDIRAALPETNELLTQQRTKHDIVVAACMDMDGCVGIMIWDYTVRSGLLRGRALVVLTCVGTGV